ncbi:ABC transporter permease [Rhizobium sp. SL86]|uniref:ABC transporter permease n=1 Tax=Rhizobium sp. SL86 TaxID=2995148 RepID=UPI0022734969|nr:ABC transporter permease [Rhizobium sp. SL86]MCY1667605.1 ABC transporter permease [Rhizobium sp. SL86]
MTTLIAWRNLVHEPVRFIATLIGVVFAVVLMAIQMGMLLGFSVTTAGLVDNARADIWMVPRGTTNVDQSSLQPQRSVFRALKTDGVETVSRHIVRFVSWRRPQGGAQLVIIVGFDPQTRMAGPWNVVEGDVADLSAPSAVMIDRLYAGKLGVSKIGDRVEINGRKAVVAGFTEGARTFTQAPYVFTTYNNALRYTDVQDGDASYVLVKAAPGVAIGDLVARLQATSPDTDIMTASAFADKSRNYWIFTTGAGTALLLGASLGAVVGVVILAQTLYAATLERIGEYATLAAIGAGHGYLNAIVLKQALICGGVGYAIAAVIASVVALLARNSPAAILLPPTALVGLGIAALVMCCLSALVAIRKLMTIDPTSVFR